MVACDFRQMDVLTGGQGAPLMPSVDSVLNNKNIAFLNIGGIANIRNGNFFNLLA
jgi:1,6-anhydro-N-acetylmuramate kinase